MTADVAAVRFEKMAAARGDRFVLEDIDLRVETGTFVGICGPNGAGKTTLIRCLLGLHPVASGRIEVFGSRVDGRGPRSHVVGYVPQRQAISRTFPASVIDVVQMGRLCCRDVPQGSHAHSRRDADRVLARAGIAHLADRPVGALSGGEQRRVLLAQALCASTRLLVLDEPTVGLDLPAEQEFYALLRRLQTELGLTILAVSHDLLALGAEADELVCLNRTIHVHGKPRSVIHSHALREAYSCEFDFLAGEIAHHERGGHEPG